MPKPAYRKIYFSIFLLFLAGQILVFACSTARHSASSNAVAASPSAINVNTADAGELEKLPGVGRSLAAKIVDHRARHGPFKKPEHLLLIEGISEKRFREFRHLIRTE